ncbi:hypothetical protein HBI53_231080 [Parastagonospora nodorum]|nr:hypothetical protein HBI53_231080 [Parastagonospora nodorum]
MSTRDRIGSNAVRPALRCAVLLTLDNIPRAPCTLARMIHGIYSNEIVDPQCSQRRTGTKVVLGQTLRRS